MYEAGDYTLKKSTASGYLLHSISVFCLGDPVSVARPQYSTPDKFDVLAGSEGRQPYKSNGAV